MWTAGWSGIGSIQHLNIELFNKMAGVKITHVLYKGAPPMNADIAAGQTNMRHASVVGVLPLIKAGRVRPIGVTSRERVGALPDVPSFSETPALAGYDLNNWVVLLAPAGTPKPILDQLHAAALQVMSLAERQKPIIEVGSIPSRLSSLLRSLGRRRRSLDRLLSRRIFSWIAEQQIPQAFNETETRAF